MITIRAVNAFQDNYIWMIQHREKPHAAVVDPGDGNAVLEYCREHQITPTAILITHHHWDHTNGVATLTQSYPNIVVYGPAHENIDGISQPLKEGDVVYIKEIEALFKVIDTPGHTSGHICYHGHGSLFCGDTLFAAGCGRLFEGTAEQMQHSLSKIRALNDDTQLYCAHEYTADNLKFARIAEPDNQAILARQQQTALLRAKNQATVPSLLSLEKQTNPFLRWDNPLLIEAAANYCNRKLNSPAEVFAAVRQWKDDLD